MSRGLEKENEGASSPEKPVPLTQFVTEAPPEPDEHRLEHTYVLSYFVRPLGKFDPEDYAIFVQPIASFCTVEQFWRVYQFIKRPGDVIEKADFHMFKKGIKPVWEDTANCKGGKWILRLKKGLSSRIWENLLLAIIGEQFLVGNEILGCVCSVRNQEDIISLWNKTADSQPIINRIRDTMRRLLNLPANAIIEYKKHDDCLKDQSSYRHTNATAQNIPFRR